MLKWLVTKIPSDASDPIFTDDPFATMGRKGPVKSEIIYSVSRVNPLYEDEGASQNKADPKDTMKDSSKGIGRRQLIPSSPPESPPTDRESVKSSGYGSKEADSVSYQSDSPDAEDAPDEEESDVIHPSKLNSPGKVSQLRKSFENLNTGEQKISPPAFEILNKNPNYVNAIEIDQGSGIRENKQDDNTEETSDGNGEQQWPKVSHLAEALKRQTERISQRRAKESATKKGLGQSTKSQILRFNPLVSVVAQDRRYVTAISVSPNSKNSQGSKQNSLGMSKHKMRSSNHRTSIDFEPNESAVPAYFKAHSVPYGTEYPLLSLQPDSLVTEDTLKMMNYTDYKLKSRKNSVDSSYADNYPSRDLPVFGKTIYSGFYSSTHSESSNPIQYARSNASSNQSACAKKKGASVVKDLWEKSGLKTNGRKFLVDVNELLQKSGQLPETGRSAGYGDEKVFSVSHYIDSNPQLYKSNTQSRPESRRFSSNFDSTSTTDSSNNYEQVIDYKHGIDNSAFIDDNGRFNGNNFKSKPNFNYNLTHFQKKVTDRMLSEPSHRKSWVDLEKPVQGHSNINNIDGTSVSRENSIGKKQKKSKNKHHPGKAIRDFGLADEKEQKGTMISSYGRPWNISMSRDIETSGQSTRNQDDQKRNQFWDYQWKSSLKDASLSSFFAPHPNSGAIYERGAEMCHDFTLDAFKVHRLSTGRAKRKYRRRCLMILLIFVALVCFLGAIVGISWYLTNGQRLFGAM